MSLLASGAHATTIGYNFDATLDSGPLAGTSFTGTLSYNEPAVVTPGVQYLALTSLDFSLDGEVFTLADLYQGGQAILDNGSLYDFTAAFLPEGPIQTIAFGFGGPGVIGYETAGQLALGTYTIESEVPEPASAWLCGIATPLLMLAWLRRRAVCVKSGTLLTADWPAR
jgi:hypothetical protein